MVARRDLNAPLVDTLRGILRTSTSKDTVPFGQKAASADEGINYTTTDGAVLRWDGDTLAAYDARITAGQQAITAATADLAKASQDLGDSAARISTAESTLAAQDKRIAAAEAAVSGQNTALAAIQGQQAKASSDASSAVQAAQDAAAQLKAIQDQIANAGASGTATTTEVQQAAQAAKAAADAAAKQARDALAAANQAQASADGKATITYTAGDPPGVGLVVGDTHYKTDAAGTVLAWWRWDGTSWIAQQVSGDVVASLDAGKITAGTLDAERIGAGAITADKITVTQDLSAAVVDAMDAQVKRLVVTDEAILDHATLIGDTAAENLNVTKRLIARDAIVDGTLDVAQLNVTDAMSAAIVKAMTVEAKKLVVTDDAILNQVTAIQSIVTPELLAQKIDVKQLGAALITSSAIQTDPGANAGVKITSTGYKAYDSAGNLSVDINGKQNLMIGSFQTNVADKTGVRISSRSSISAIDYYSADAGTTGQGTLNGAHGFSFFSSTGSLGSTNFALGAMNRADGLTDDDPQIVFYPFDKSVNFMGKFGGLGSAMRTGMVTLDALAGGAYRDTTVTFSAMTSAAGVCVLPSLVAANKTEFAYVITNDSKSGFTIRIVNKSSNNSGTIWMKYIALAISN